MKQIITISREFGSGGHEIGETLAKELNIPYYDKEIIAEIAEKTGFSAKFIEEQAEHAPSKSLFSYGFIGRDASGSSVADQIFAAQTRIIRELADKGSCVIVGRCADYILRDHPDAIHAFIYGKQAVKCERIMRLYNKSEKEALTLMHDMDKKRSINYNYCCDRKWGQMRNYTISLDSSTFGIEGCVKLLRNSLNQGLTRSDLIPKTDDTGL